MNDTKALYLVLVYPQELNLDEAKRINDAISSATGEDARRICKNEITMVFLAFAEFSDLRRRLEEALALTTQLLIVQACAPWSTKGFSPTCATLQKHLRHH